MKTDSQRLRDVEFEVLALRRALEERCDHLDAWVDHIREMVDAMAGQLGVSSPDAKRKSECGDG